jgi:hypothetical protein
MKTSKVLHSIKTMNLRPGTALVISGDGINEKVVARLREVFEKLLGYRVPVLGVSDGIRFEVIALPERAETVATKE